MSQDKHETIRFVTGFALSAICVCTISICICIYCLKAVEHPITVEHNQTTTIDRN